MCGKACVSAWGKGRGAGCRCTACHWCGPSCVCRQDLSDGGSDEPPSRRLVAFVGGLDLAEGRYDTHDHPLFATTQEGGPHHKDMYQGCIGGRLGTTQPQASTQPECCVLQVAALLVSVVLSVVVFSAHGFTLLFVCLL
jgi:hypothetical protein